MNIEQGVTEYLRGALTLALYLPRKKPSCKYCKFLDKDRSADRYYCRITGTIIYDEFLIMSDCPVIWELEEGEKR